MDDATRVRMSECGGDGRAEPARLVPAKGPFREAGVEGLALDELHHEHGPAAVLEHVVEADDVRVLETCECGGLALEALAQLRVVGDPRVEHLERDDAAEPLVAGAPDHAHTALAELLQGAISP